ncbi:Aste57867_13360 [Aphanomyces stellatus]|uniref:Aste57867_13360 protein n=1 Tax=Aphanomyces stellatus TaxID=120398 RepID=A0A485KY86_9STRA|nr:hypothetical protein As57867_013310 [Aphanomyces stellatus]VFT90199.1 Aste57867_13360 [Aphanomyces stellatus]
MMKGLPSFNFDVRQDWIDLSLADEATDAEEEQRNWEWFQVSHDGHASPRKAPLKQPLHAVAAKPKPSSAKGKEEDFIKQMLKEHNAKVKQGRTSNANETRPHHQQANKSHIPVRKTPSDERKNSLDCSWHSIQQENLTRRPSKDVLGYISEQGSVKLGGGGASDSDDLGSNPRRKRHLVSPAPAKSTTLNSSHQSPDPNTRSDCLVKSPHEDLQDMLVELKASKQAAAAAASTTTTTTASTKATVAPSTASQVPVAAIRVINLHVDKGPLKRKVPKEQLELELLVQKHNDKHKQRRLSGASH